MGFRDDEDAQRVRAERLEAELRAREAELRRKDEELERLRAAAAEHDAADVPSAPQPAPRKTFGERIADLGENAGDWLGWLGAGMGILGLVVGVVVPLGQAASCLCARAPGASGPPADLPRHVATSWSATVGTARGTERLGPGEIAALAPGSPCLVTADLASDGASVVVATITIVCGTATLFPWTPLGPGAAGACEVSERSLVTGERRYGYGLLCHDPGGVGRPALALATRDGTARVVAGPMEIELVVERASAEHTGEPLMVGNAPFRPGSAAVERAAHVAETTGPAPHPVGAPCTLRVLPVAGGGAYDCMVRLACEGRPLYGDDARNDGYGDCVEDVAGVPVRMSDPRPSAVDTDPAIELDVLAGSARVSDATGGAPWTVTVALDAAAAR